MSLSSAEGGRRSKIDMRTPPRLLFFFSAVFGAVMWAFLGLITEDPFDSILYPVLLIAGGAATAWLNSVGTWRWAAGNRQVGEPRVAH
jgi:hypothetical protein